MLNQIQQELTLIDSLLKRWLVGGAINITADCIPHSWQLETSNLTQSELRRCALILASQQRHWLLSHEVPEQGNEQPLLPKLSLPCLSHTNRVLFCKSLALVQSHGFSIKQLLNLLTNRGFCAHPSDWLPNKNDDVPTEYWPWSLWVANQTQAHLASEIEALSCDNWPHYLPAQRVSMLTNMRLEKPQHALAIIEQCIGDEAAEKRVKIVETLAINLSEHDKPFLESMLQNRSQKVVAVAQKLLSRLNSHVNSSPSKDQIDMATELVDWLEVTSSGLIRKTTHIKPKQLKSKKQQALRSEWLEQVSLNALANALTIDLKTLISGWQFDQFREYDNLSFIENLTQTLPDDYVHILLSSLLSDAVTPCFRFIECVLPRLDQPQREELMIKLLNDEKAQLSFSDCLTFIEQPNTRLDWQQIKTSAAWQVLLSDIKDQLTDASYIESYHSTRGLVALGLCVDANCAQQILNALIEIGAMNTDPILDTIKLNIQLSHPAPVQVKP